MIHTKIVKTKEQLKDIFSTIQYIAEAATNMSMTAENPPTDTISNIAAST